MGRRHCYRAELSSDMWHDCVTHVLACHAFLASMQFSGDSPTRTLPHLPLPARRTTRTPARLSPSRTHTTTTFHLHPALLMAFARILMPAFDTLPSHLLPAPCSTSLCPAALPLSPDGCYTSLPRIQILTIGWMDRACCRAHAPAMFMALARPPLPATARALQRTCLNTLPDPTCLC